MQTLPIYLDGHATSPLAPEALEAMIAALSQPGNAASPHVHGEMAARHVSYARECIANLIGARPNEVIFTSGATEANNLAILGVARHAALSQSHRNRIAVSAIEHKSVLEPAKALRNEGFAIDIIPVDSEGRLDLGALRAIVGPSTLLVSVMAANNETGVLQDIPVLGEVVHEAGALLHTDAAQAAGKVAIDVLTWDVDYLSLSGHKLYGPAGVGALFVAAGVPLPAPLMFGGGQQKAVRPGTEPVALLAGFGAAARVATERLSHDQVHGRTLVERLRAGLVEHQVRFTVTTGNAPVAPGSLSLALIGQNAEELVQILSNIVSLSTGSACNSGQILPSHVFSAMNAPSDIISSVVRIFCGRYNTATEIDVAVEAIARAVANSALAPGEVRQ